MKKIYFLLAGDSAFGFSGMEIETIGMANSGNLSIDNIFFFQTKHETFHVQEMRFICVTASSVNFSTKSSKSKTIIFWAATFFIKGVYHEIFYLYFL